MNRATRSSRKRSPRYGIRIADRQDLMTVDPKRVRQIVRTTLQAEEVAAATVSVALVDNATIRQVNRRHLEHDYATDVLSFLFDSEPAADGQAAAQAGPGESLRSEPRSGRPFAPRGRARRIDGEIIASAEMAVESASRFQWTPGDELALYLVHGLLHLCGYDDLAPAQRRVMRGRERAILHALGIRPAGRRR